MTIHLLNPNSLTEVTAGIDRAIAPMRAHAPVPIACHTLAEGPPGIETAEHIAAVVSPLLRQAEGLAADASAFIIACYSDPGLAELRGALDQPVLGIGEAAVLTAMGLGGRFGTISILPASIPRHMAALEAMGVTGRCAGDLALGLTVPELADPGRTEARLEEVGRALRDEHRAESLILGCAGMARYRAGLEAKLGLPVIDPCQAATAMAIGALALKASEEAT